MSELMKRTRLWNDSVLNVKLIQPTLLYFQEVHSDEKFNSYSHLLGTILGVIGTFNLVFQSFSSWKLMIFSVIYGLSTTFLFLASTLWHSQKQTKGNASIWQKLDHIAIILLISSTRNWIWIMDPSLDFKILIYHWIITLVCIAIFIFFNHIPRWTYAFIYVSLGWISLFYLAPIFSDLPKVVIGLMIAGGILYTIGAMLFVLKKPTYFHEIFHVLVLIASGFFYVAIVQVAF